MSSQQRIKFGVLGTSHIAKKSAIPAIIASDSAELLMIGSRSKENAQACAQEFGCDSYGTYDDVLANPDVDAVYISLPNSLHEEWSIKAAKAGKHVWCEKPAALTYESAKRMVAAAKEHHVRLMEGFMFLYHPQHAKVLELIASGTLGEFVSFSGSFILPMPESSNIRLDASLGGGALNDAGTYPIRASRMIFSETPESVSAGLAIDAQTGVDMKADMTLTYSGGRTASASAAFGGEYLSTYEVVGTEGRLWMERAYAVPRDRAVKIFLEKDGGVSEFAFEPADQFKLMIEEFCREIALGSASTKDYEQDLVSQARVLEAGRISHAEDRIVNLLDLH